jgi:hypothetical protein
MGLPRRRFTKEFKLAALQRLKMGGVDRGTMQFQRTANSVLTVCLTPGDNPIPTRPSNFAKIRTSRACAQKASLAEPLRFLRTDWQN